MTQFNQLTVCVLTVGRLVNVDEHMRAFIQTKSNLAPMGKPQAFGLDPVGGFSWLGDCAVTIEELLDGKNPRKAPGNSNWQKPTSWDCSPTAMSCLM